jgi:hypothetical protein
LGSPAQLNHQVIAPRGRSDVSRQYACDEGRYLVVTDGFGYQADPLDLELHWRGETCAE